MLIPIQVDLISSAKLNVTNLTYVPGLLLSENDVQGAKHE